MPTVATVDTVLTDVNPDRSLVTEDSIFRVLTRASLQDVTSNPWAHVAGVAVDSVPGDEERAVGSQHTFVPSVATTPRILTASVWQGCPFV